jgi:catecholate siderophore receptor
MNIEFNAGSVRMSRGKTPRSLRTDAIVISVNDKPDSTSGRKVSAVAGLIAAASFTGAEAQQTNLPPVMIYTPVPRPRPVASKPSPDQIRARTALRRAARGAQPEQVAAVPFPSAGGLQRPDRNPYADAAAPYKVDRLQASGKFPEPLLRPWC